MTAETAAISPVSLTLEDRRDRLAALYDVHEDRLYRLARRLTASADDARDLVQETFLRAATSLRSVPVGPAKEEAWLVRVLINIRRDQWRKIAVRQRSAEALRADATPHPSKLDAVLIAKQTVWAALDSLTPRRRAIVIMHELDGTSVSTIASVLGISRMMVQWHLSMARRDLKRVLASHLGETK